MPPGIQNTERLASAMLWEAVRQLPSTMARLVFLSGLRDLNSGAYRAPTASKAESKEVDRFLRSMHEEAFSTWLDYTLEEQKADLDLYLSGLITDKLGVIRTWLNLESYRLIVPASAESMERQLFFSDLELLLYLMANEVPGRTDEGQRRAQDGRLLTAKDLSRKLGVSCRTLCLWAERHKMPAVKLGRQRRFSMGAVREWLCSAANRAGCESSGRTARDLRDNASPPETPTCPLRCAGTGISALSAREREVLNLIGQGNASKEIAALLFISNTTVSEYRKRICRKLGLHSTGELAACAVERLSGTCRQVPPSKNSKVRL